MIVVLAAAALWAVPQGEGKLVMNAYMPGPREVVVGLSPYPETQMRIIYEKEVQPTFTAQSGAVGGGGLDERTLGWIRWSVTPTMFAGKECYLLKEEGQLNEKVRKATVTINESRQSWVTLAGKIVRQFDSQTSPIYTRSANSVYHEDSIDVSVEDEKGRRTTTVYPTIPFSKLDAQFTPMMKGESVLLREKEYYVFDPFTLKCDKFLARVNGAATGTEFRKHFVGKSFEIAGPELTYTAAVSNEGDLIRMEYPHDRFAIMNGLPPGKH